MEKLLLVLLFILICAPAAFAGPRYKAALSAAKVAAKKQEDFSKKVAALTRKERLQLKKQLSGSTKYGANSDDDALPDIYEDAIGSNLCSDDSDGDGREDDSDNDEGELELKGLVVSFEAPNLVVAGKNFTVTDSTSFRGVGFDAADLVVGACVEVKGRMSTGTLKAVRIKQESSCQDEDSED